MNYPVISKVLGRVMGLEAVLMTVSYTHLDVYKRQLRNGSVLVAHSGRLRGFHYAVFKLQSSDFARCEYMWEKLAGHRCASLRCVMSESTAQYNCISSIEY